MHRVLSFLLAFLFLLPNVGWGARGFGATDGSGSTDSITIANTTHYAQMTVSFWASRNSAGNGDLGRLLQKATSADLRPTFRMVTNGIVWGLLFFSNHTTPGEWAFPTTGAGSNAGQWNCFRYDESSTANDPTVYIDGTVGTMVENAAPSGALAPNAESWVLGNRKSDGIRNWDGKIAQFAMWNRIVSDTECAALSRGYDPLWFPRGLVIYVPLVRSAHDYRNATTTLVGTAVKAHPRTIPVWASRFFGSFAAQVVASGCPKTLVLLGVGC